MDFWKQQHIEYPALSGQGCVLSPFFWDHISVREGFTSRAVKKNEYRSRIDAEPRLRLKLTLIYPDSAPVSLGLWKFRCQHAGQLIISFVFSLAFFKQVVGILICSLAMCVWVCVRVGMKCSYCVIVNVVTCSVSVCS